MKREKSGKYSLADEENFYLIEAYKILRTNLEYSIINSSHKVIMVTSAVPEEGKSNITANLGVFLTQIGYKVLLIDCDLRTPKLHCFFNLPNMSGVTNIIFKKVTVSDAICEVNSKLHVLSTGAIPPNAVEILNSKEMKTLIDIVAENYDYVLIDTPPSAFLTDASVLAANTSGVLFVVKYSSTPLEMIKNAVENLKKANANILGVILSQVDISKYVKGNKYMKHYYTGHRRVRKKAVNVNSGYRFKA